MSANGIPQPTIPEPRPRRRSSIEQAANVEAAASGGDSSAGQGSGQVEPKPSEEIASAPAQTIRSGMGKGKVRPVSTSKQAQPSAGSPSKGIMLALPEDLKQRMMNTITWTAPHTGIRHQQVFIRQSIADLCERLEEAYNSGRPYPDLPS